MRGIFLGLLSAFVASTSYAQDVEWKWEDASTIERKAYDCAALMFILTGSQSYGKADRISVNATLGGRILGPVAGVNTSRRLGSPITNGYMFRVRDKEMRLWAARWVSGDKSAVVSEAGECLGWINDIGYEASTGAVKSPQDVSYDGPYPLPNGIDADTLNSAVPMAFDAWFKAGAISPEDVKELMRRETN